MRRGAVRSRDCSVALQPENASRNRYKDILPCTPHDRPPDLADIYLSAAADDDTRVPLQSGDNDYVNANFVKCDTGVGEFTYIASQVLRNLW